MSPNEREPREPKIKITDKRRIGRSRPDAAATSEVEDVFAEEAQAAGEVTEDIARLEAEAAEYRDHLLRLQAEFDNYRKRMTREQQLAAEFGALPVVDQLLGVVDDFELALIAAEAQPDHESFLRGVELVYAKFIDALRAAGVEKLDPVGQPFDPEQHEALLQEGEGEGEPVVADVLRPGYTMKGRVIRPAQVKVKR